MSGAVEYCDYGKDCTKADCGRLHTCLDYSNGHCSAGNKCRLEHDAYALAVNNLRLKNEPCPFQQKYVMGIRQYGSASTVAACPHVKCRRSHDPAILLGTDTNIKTSTTAQHQPAAKPFIGAVSGTAIAVG
jgi:hypothetical protein